MSLTIRRTASAVLLFGIVSVPIAAYADDDAPECVDCPGSPSVRLDRFTPAPGNEGLWQVEGPAADGPPVVSVFAEHARSPLVIRQGEAEARVVPSQTVLHLAADVGVADFLRVFATMPFTLHADEPDRDARPYATTEDDRIGRAGLGDLQVGARATFYRDERVAVGASSMIGIPSATGSYWNGSGGFTFEGSILCGLHFGPVDFLFDAGARSRPVEHLLNVVVGPEVSLGIGARLTPIDWLQLSAEFLGDTGLLSDSAFKLESTRLEVLGRARITPWADWGFDVGGGMGFIDGYGSPSARVMTAITVPIPAYVAPRKASDPKESQPEPRQPTEEDFAKVIDRDGDGVVDAKDRCIDLPETRDGVLDEDGCPEGYPLAPPPAAAAPAPEIVPISTTVLIEPTP